MCSACGFQMPLLSSSLALGSPFRIYNRAKFGLRGSRTMAPTLQISVRTNCNVQRVNMVSDVRFAGDLAQELADAGKLHRSDVPLFCTLTEARAKRLQRVVESRTRHVTFCFDEVHGAHNLAAVVRSCDAWGLQDLHIVLGENNVKVDDSDSSSRAPPDLPSDFMKNSLPISGVFDSASTKKVSKGAHKWLSISQHQNVNDAITSLKRKGYRLIVSSLDPSARKLADVEILSTDPTCFVFGNEHSGVSEEMYRAADELFTIPMYGFVESTNVSVAAAVVASSVTERLHASRNNACDHQYFLTPPEQADLYRKFLAPTRPFRASRTVHTMTSKYDATKLGTELERRIAQHGLFDTFAKNELKIVGKAQDRSKHTTRDLLIQMEDSLELSPKIGRPVFRYFTKRAQFSALSDRGSTDGFERRCSAINECISGLGALTCESVLFYKNSEFAGIRHKLLPLFRRTISAINTDYSVIFDRSGFPKIPLHSTTSAEMVQAIDYKCTTHVWREILAYAKENALGELDALISCVVGATCVDMASLISDTIRFEPEYAQLYKEFGRNASRHFAKLEIFLRDLEPSRDDFLHDETQHSVDGPGTLQRNNEEFFHVLLRLAQCANIVSSLHACAWEKERGLKTRRVQSVRYGLLESILAVGHSELKQLSPADEVLLSRGLYEWIYVLSKLKKAAVDDSLSGTGAEIEAGKTS